MKKSEQKIPLCPQCMDNFNIGLIELDMCMGCLVNEVHKKEIKLTKVIESGNQLDYALTCLLENDEIECRSDDDCDHCHAVQAVKQWTKTMKEITGIK